MADFSEFQYLPNLKREVRLLMFLPAVLLSSIDFFPFFPPFFFFLVLLQLAMSACHLLRLAQDLEDERLLGPLVSALAEEDRLPAFFRVCDNK